VTQPEMQPGLLVWGARAESTATLRWLFKLLYLLLNRIHTCVAREHQGVFSHYLTFMRTKRQQRARWLFQTAAKMLVRSGTRFGLILNYFFMKN